MSSPTQKVLAPRAQEAPASGAPEEKYNPSELDHQGSGQRESVEAPVALAPRPLIDRTAPWGEVYGSLRGAQKSNKNAPAYSRWINRPLGRAFAATAYRVGITPNQMSCISACFTFSGIALIAVGSPTWPAGFVIAALLMLGYALDSADGQIARLSGAGSIAGEWLDHMFDACKVSSFHLAVTILWVRHLDGWPMWTSVIPLVFAWQSSVWFFGIIFTDVLMRNAGLKKQLLAVEEGTQRMWTSFLGIPADYGFLCLFMTLLGWWDGWRPLYAALTIINVLILGLQAVRWFRRLR